MTLPRCRALRRYWQAHPPTHLLVAAWLGFQPGASRHDPGDLGELARMFGLAPGGRATIA